MNISRRKAIGTAGLAVGAFLAGQFSSVSAEKPQKEEAVEWKPVKLDPKKVAARAYEIYPEGSCMYAAFTAIATAMAEAAAKVNPALSQALKNFPCQMFKYGHSGLGGQGTLCGAVNGACAIFGLFVHDKAKLDTLTAELCGYYETTELPIFKPKSSKFEPMPASVSGSVLCHVSQMKWCEKSNQSPFSEFRSDRCKRLTADIAAKAVEILNRYAESEDAKFKSPSTANARCVQCHGKKGTAANVSAKMNCIPCHGEKEDHYN